MLSCNVTLARNVTLWRHLPRAARAACSNIITRGKIFSIESGQNEILQTVIQLILFIYLLLSKATIIDIPAVVWLRMK